MIFRLFFDVFLERQKTSFFLCAAPIALDLGPMGPPWVPWGPKGFLGVPRGCGLTAKSPDRVSRSVGQTAHRTDRASRSVPAFW